MSGINLRPKVTHVLLASIGNPGAYLSTLHSAGHIALEALRQELEMPPFTTMQPFGVRISTLTSMTPGGRYTLVQSPMLMNVSGPWLAQVYRAAKLQEERKAGDLALVLLHDFIDKRTGHVRLRRWNTKPRGHNGLKSVDKAFPRDPGPGLRLVRMPICIGRPSEEESEALADWLLRPLNREQTDVLGRIGPSALKTLKKLEEQWARETEDWEKGLAKWPGPDPRRPKRKRRAGKGPWDDWLDNE